jgi:hypothetical protein
VFVDIAVTVSRVIAVDKAVVIAFCFEGVGSPTIRHDPVKVAVALIARCFCVLILCEGAGVHQPCGECYVKKAWQKLFKKYGVTFMERCSGLEGSQLTTWGEGGKATASSRS